MSRPTNKQIKKIKKEEAEAGKKIIPKITAKFKNEKTPEQLAAEEESRRKASASGAGKDPKTGRFIKGNKWWQVGASQGREKILGSPEIMMECCLEYFQWVEDNPWIESKGQLYHGEQVDIENKKMRMPTEEGLCVFLGISYQCWRKYAKNEEFSETVEYVQNIIRNHALSGAASDLLNASIVARYLGLKDRVESEHTGKDGEPIKTISANMDSKEASRIYKDMLENK